VTLQARSNRVNTQEYRFEGEPDADLQAQIAEFAGFIFVRSGKSCKREVQGLQGLLGLNSAVQENSSSGGNECRVCFRLIHNPEKAIRAPRLR
jgi:hypothetical protein